jgi:hypothetical protein
VRSVAFYRDFRGFTGGHLKVWDYFCHTKCSRLFNPTIYFTVNSHFDASNPWKVSGESREAKWAPEAADVLFLGGLDWLAVPEHNKTPVINLIQHVRHADPKDVRYPFLCRRATRICYSQPVKEALLSSGQVNGPVVLIPMGLDLGLLPDRSPIRDIPILIAGLKQPRLAEQLAERFKAKGITHLCLTSLQPRRDYLELLGRAKVTVFLPNPTEGFYIRALEGMAMGTVVVCPDCVGNRDFCIPGTNCYMPEFEAGALLAESIAALHSDREHREQMLIAAEIEANGHTVQRERKKYLELLESFSFTNI